MDAIESGYGHVLVDGDSAIFTSQKAAMNCISSLIKIIGAMATDISRITDIPCIDVIKDYKEELELDLMTAAFNSVVRKNGGEIIQQPTRIILEEYITNKDGDKR